MSSIEQLLTPIYDEDGVRSVNFFNGRVLSGEDLSDEQEAQRQARRLVGQAVGEGVAFGLEVSEASGEVSTAQYPVISVEPGLAVNRAGQTLRLSARADVGLVRQEDASTASQTRVTFRDCRPVNPTLYVAAESVYLLTLAPAEGREGEAPNAGYAKIPASENVRYIVEGVQFRLIELKAADDIGDRDVLRNRVAYECFGVEDTAVIESNLLGPPVTTYGTLDALRESKSLTDCEVPLALLFWSATGGIEFIDMWSVRRRVTKPDGFGRWGLLTGDRRASETEAMILQFQEHVGDIFRRLSPDSVVASKYFRYLPPAGLLPVQRKLKSGENFGGFDPNNFFKGRAHRPPVFIDGGALRPLFREAANYEPIDLNGPETVLLYQTTQNAQESSARETVQPFVVFTTPYMRGIGSARFNVARFNFSNLAE
jgi:hypothetical protein